MTDVLNGKELSEVICKEIKRKLRKLDYKPKLAIIRLGEEEADISYEKGLKASAKKVGIDICVYKYSKKISTEDLIEVIEKLNKDSSVNGILIFRPLPKHIDENRVNLTIDAKKDVDCMSPLNKAKIYDGDITGFIPLSPKAAIMLLEYYNYRLTSKNVVIINRTKVVGRPLTMILLNRDATVTITHSKSKELKNHTKYADFVFTAMGLSSYLDKSYFKKGAVVVDMGFSIDKNGKVSGDLDVESNKGYLEAYTPVPGGVGMITNLLLLESMVENE